MTTTARLDVSQPGGEPENFTAEGSSPPSLTAHYRLDGPAGYTLLPRTGSSAAARRESSAMPTCSVDSLELVSQEPRLTGKPVAESETVVFAP
jgi:hypothetical protein